MPGLSTDLDTLINRSRPADPKVIARRDAAAERLAHITTKQHLDVAQWQAKAYKGRCSFLENEVSERLDDTSRGTTRLEQHTRQIQSDIQQAENLLASNSGKLDIVSKQHRVTQSRVRGLQRGVKYVKCSRTPCTTS